MPPLVSLKPPGWVAEFRTFIMRGNVVDLAVGVIIGAAFTGIVNSLVKDIINPVIGLALGGVDFSDVFVALDGRRYDTIDAARKAGAATLNVGLFLNAVINFLIIAVVIFAIVKLISRVMREKEAEAAAPTASELLLAEIRDLLASRPQVQSSELPTRPSSLR